MSRSRRKNWNTVDAASLARWIVLTAFLALTGLGYVYLTLQLYHLGDRKKILETQLSGLRTQNDEASGQIAAWAVEAQEVFLYIRDEYPAALKIGMVLKLPEPPVNTTAANAR